MRQTTQRANIRNAFLVASKSESKQGFESYLEENDLYAAACLVELLGDDYSFEDWANFETINKINQIIAHNTNPSETYK